MVREALPFRDRHRQEFCSGREAVIQDPSARAKARLEQSSTLTGILVENDKKGGNAGLMTLEWSLSRRGSKEEMTLLAAMHRVVQSSRALMNK